MKVNLGAADISFELWHQGVKLSKDESIKVEWQATAPPDPNQHMDLFDVDFPMNTLPAAQGPRTFNFDGNDIKSKLVPMANGVNGGFGRY